MNRLNTSVNPLLFRVPNITDLDHLDGLVNASGFVERLYEGATDKNNQDDHERPKQSEENHPHLSPPLWNCSELN